MSSNSSTDTEVRENKDTKDTRETSNLEMIKAVSIILVEIIEESKDSTKDTQAAGKEVSLTLDKAHTVYNSKKPPSIPIQSYFERIVKYSKLEESTLIITLIYIDRLCDLTGITLTDVNIHRYKSYNGLGSYWLLLFWL
jgi:hypothetical protein